MKYKYLCVIIDNQLNLDKSSKNITKKDRGLCL